MTTQEKNRPNAHEQYLAACDDIGAMLDLIGQEMTAHARRAAAAPKPWGAVGDALNIRADLKDALQFLLVGQHGWTETEASEFIEEHVESMREDKK